MESDWKKFSAMLPVWRERYLVERNARIVRMLIDPTKTETQRFWDAEEQVLKEAKTLRRCLDDLSRSKMWLRLMEMRAAGMLRREDLADFSAELQQQVFYDPPGRR
jgi:c-di-GMP-binding flagellar brake protein YcgR